MIRSAVAAADARQRREPLGVLLFDHLGDVLHRADHRPQGLLRPDAIDRAEHLEELALDLREKADQPRRHAAARRIAVVVVDRVQADRLADQRLQLSGGSIRR